MAYCYLDAETYIEIRRIRRMEGRDGETYEQATLFSDYREVAGVMIPYAIEAKGGGRRGIGGGLTIIDEILVNQPIDDTVFAMPAKKSE